MTARVWEKTLPARWPSSSGASRAHLVNQHAWLGWHGPPRHLQSHHQEQAHAPAPPPFAASRISTYFPYILWALTWDKLLCHADSREHLGKNQITAACGQARKSQAMATGTPVELQSQYLAHRSVRCTHCRSRNLDPLKTGTPKVEDKNGQVQCDDRARRKLRGAACLHFSRQHP